MTITLLMVNIFLLPKNQYYKDIKEEIIKYL